MDDIDLLMLKKETSNNDIDLSFLKSKETKENINKADTLINKDEKNKE